MEEYLSAGSLQPATVARLVADRKVFPCYFGAALPLEGVGQPGPAVLEYRFTFVEDPAYADILGASGARSAQLLEGETLYTLARRMGVNAAELVVANPQIADPMSPERGSTVWLP